MVRTGARAAVLADLLQQGGFRLRPTPAVPRLSVLPANLGIDVLEVYAALGGVLSSPKLRPGSWDLAFEDDLVVELDEELHFNRYRLLARRAVYNNRPWALEYRRLCADHEDDCLLAGKWGRRWTNDSCVAMFGPAGTAGELHGPGAPRWKQRALYDAIKDLGPFAYELQVARLSVHDRVGDVTLGAALEQRTNLDIEALVELVGLRSV